MVHLRLRSSITYAFMPAAGLFAILTVATGCAGVRSAFSGLAPLDSARAVAIAQRNLCGSEMPASDTTCVVREYRRDGGRHIVTLDRRPPAGNDRVIVTLRDNGSQIEVAEADSAAHKP